MHKKKIMKLKYEFDISNEELDLLRKTHKTGYAEYRDTEYDNLADFLNKNDGFRTEESFLVRNCGGTHLLALELFEKNLIDHVEDSWHITYKVSDFALKLIDQWKE